MFKLLKIKTTLLVQFQASEILVNLFIFLTYKCILMTDKISYTVIHIFQD